MKQMTELIKELRSRTDAGIMDCKRALEANDCDMEKAIDWLREKGISKVQAKASRIAAEGLALIKTDGNDTAIAEVNCETDFVSKGDKFRRLVEDILTITLMEKPKDMETAKKLTTKLITDATIAMGEKLDYRRFEIISREENQIVSSYIHMNGKIAVLVVLEGGDETLAKNLAMHIAANSPRYISDTDIPEDVIKHERKICSKLVREDENLKNKPEELLNNIVERKVQKTLSDSILLKQVYLLDTEKTVENILTNAKAKVIKFVRYAVGEGINTEQTENKQ